MKQRSVEMSFAAALEADRVLQEAGVTSLPVDPFEIAARHGITVSAKSAEDVGVSGMLIQVGGCFGISYATHIASDGFQRFSVAHELGHYFMPGHLDAVLGEGGVHSSRAEFVSRDRFEEEADHFAANLLMPKRLFGEALRKAGSGLAGIEKLSNVCRTSLVATAIRYSQCTTDAVAIIVSAGKSIDFCFMSEALKDLKGIDWIRKRQAVPPGTPTAEFNSDFANIEGGRRIDGSCDIQDWFGGRTSIEVSEEAVGLGRYGKTLTLLYDIEIPEPEDEEEEEALRESWTPRFR